MGKSSSPVQSSKYVQIYTALLVTSPGIDYGSFPTMYSIV